MLDLCDYIIEKDPTPPDFIAELFEDEKIKQKEKEWMSEKERKLI